MKKELSSPFTFILKFGVSSLLITLILGFTVVGCTVMYYLGGAFYLPAVYLLLIPLVLTVFGRIKKVDRDGDFLIITNFKRDERIHGSMIENVCYNIFSRQIRIDLAEPGAFGKSIVFTPTVCFFCFFTHPVVDEIKSIMIEASAHR